MTQAKTFAGSSLRMHCSSSWITICFWMNRKQKRRKRQIPENYNPELIRLFRRILEHRVSRKERKRTINPARILHNRMNILLKSRNVLAGNGPENPDEFQKPDSTGPGRFL